MLAYFLWLGLYALVTRNSEKGSSFANLTGFTNGLAEVQIDGIRSVMTDHEAHILDHRDDSVRTIELLTEENFTVSTNGEDVVLTNKIHSSETLTFTNIDVGIDQLTFDIFTSEGHRIDGIVITAGEDQLKITGHIRLLMTAAALVLDAIVTASSESDCSVAIKACADAGGKPSTTIKDNWFGYSCTVRCN